MRLTTFAAALGLILCNMGVAAGDQPKPKTHTVTIEGMRFQPEVLTVAPGDTIVWVNKGRLHAPSDDEGDVARQVDRLLDRAGGVGMAISKQQ